MNAGCHWRLVRQWLFPDRSTGGQAASGTQKKGQQCHPLAFPRARPCRSAIWRLLSRTLLVSVIEWIPLYPTSIARGRSSAEGYSTLYGELLNKIGPELSPAPAGGRRVAGAKRVFERATVFLRGAQVVVGRAGRFC